MDLICIPLVANDDDHLFTCLFAICISSSVKCLSIFFVLLLIGLFICFLLLRFETSLYVLVTSFLLDL